MHLTAYENATRFKDAYPVSKGEKIAEIGSQVIAKQQSLRALFKGCEYTGFDFAAGKGVDVILDDPYSLPAEANTFDRVISSSCFEHSEFFWISFLEMLRICKDDGLIYLQAPSNGAFHRYPIDCWRFYPDSGVALQNWGLRNNINVTLLESFTTPQKADCWNDFVAVFAKSKENEIKYNNRILHDLKTFDNGIIHGQNNIINFTQSTEDMARRPWSKFHN